MNLLLVLDSVKYKVRGDDFCNDIFNCKTDLFYTDYENRLIKLFHGLPLAGNLLAHISYWLISVFSAMTLIVRFRKKYTHIVFINPIVGFFYCLFLPRRNITGKIYLAGFLFVPKSSTFYYKARRKLVNRSLKIASGIFVYSFNEIKVYSQLFPDLALKFKFIRYGRDFDIFSENEFDMNTGYIASGGVSNRDYNTLISAMNLLGNRYPDLKCRIATRPGSYYVKYESSSTELLFNIRIDRFGSFIDKSMFFVLPLLNTSLSGGHMTLLESMYRGRNIIVADLPSIRDYVDDDLVFFYNPGDAYDLAEKIEYLYENYKDPEICYRKQKLTETYRSEYCFTSFLNRIANEIVC
jgi:glycosyltransferase involved in cell wall biosynthesis